MRPAIGCQRLESLRIAVYHLKSTILGALRWRVDCRDLAQLERMEGVQRPRCTLSNVLPSGEAVTEMTL